MLGAVLDHEIRQQPSTLATLIERGRDPVERVAERIREFAPEFVLFAARGTSDNAARYAQYVFGAHNRLSVGLAVPSLYTLYDTPPITRRALVVGVSQSGQSPDIVAVVRGARQHGSLTVAVTNDPDSPLGRASEHVLPLFAGREEAVAATKTYSSELCCLAMLSAALEGSPARWEELARVPDAVEEAIRMNDGVDQLAARFWDATQLIVAGRGFNYCTAFEIALKVKETSGVFAEAHSPADLLHGPMAVVDRGFPVMLIAPSGRTLEDALGLLAKLEQRGAEVIALSDREEILSRVHGALPFPQSIPEWLTPLVAVVPGQRFALALATARGLDPDAPHGLTKVTRTL